MSKLIPLSNCDKCLPMVWGKAPTNRPSSGTYYCILCKKIINHVLVPQWWLNPDKPHPGLQQFAEQKESKNG